MFVVFIEFSLAIILDNIIYCTGSKGNRLQQTTPMVMFVLLSGILVVGYVFFLEWQTYM